MALRERRGARHGRARLGRAGFVGLGLALYGLAAAVVTWPALRQADERFLALPDPGHGGPAPGDHLQVTYQLWLAGHRLARGEPPWIDPYSFQPAADGVVALQGWLFGLPLWPLFAAFGPVAAWNAFVLGSYVLAGGAAAAWLRALGLPRSAALVGGLAFAVAPYRVAQSTGHLLGPISALLPVALYGVERAVRGRPAWTALAAAALVALPLSGQLHLALGAIPFVLAYALVRTRSRPVALGVAAASAAAAAVGLAVQQVVIGDSTAAEGRTLRAVGFFSPDWVDFVAREMRHPAPYGVEMVVFAGWVTPFLALAGLVLLVRRRRLGLAALLALGVAVPVWLALGTNVPTYELLWEHVPPFRYPRVPERLLPIAVLCLGALVAVLVERFRGPAVAVAAAALLLVDLRVPLYAPAAADPASAAYAALAESPRGRLLNLPVFPPGRHEGSVYLYYELQAPRERPGGYSTTAPREAAAIVGALRPLQCGTWSRARVELLRRLGVRHVAVHAGLYRRGILVEPVCRVRAERALEANGFRRVASDGAVTLFSVP